MIRLHKNAAVLVTKDAEALAEARATAAGQLCIGPPISPTVAWIDHMRVAMLRDTLSRAGYAPRSTTDEEDARRDG